MGSAARASGLASAVLGGACSASSVTGAVCARATCVGAQALNGAPAIHARRVPQCRTLNRTRSWYHARLVRAHWTAFRERFACWALCVVCAQCTPVERGPVAGASDSWKNAGPRAVSSATPEPAVWQRYAEAQGWPAANSAPFPSRGHQPEQQVDVRVNDVARSSYVALVTDTVFPEGSLLFEQAHGHEGLGYAMHKAGGRWSFIQLDARGAVLASGALAVCAGCHAQAPADQVFGLPRAP